MSQSGRLLDLVQELRRRDAPVSAADLAEELGVSTRTIYRDIAILSARGLPVRGAAGLGYVLGAGGFLPPLAFDESELDAIMLGLRWVEKRADGALTRAAQDALAKIVAVVPERLRQVLNAPRVFVGPDLPEPATGVELAVLRTAIERGLKIDLDYRDREGAVSHRWVWPIGLAFMEDDRFLIGFCELRGEFRHFRLDRILSAESGEPFSERRPVLLRRWREQLAAEEVAARQAAADIPRQGGGL